MWRVWIIQVVCEWSNQVDIRLIGLLLSKEDGTQLVYIVPGSIVFMHQLKRFPTITITVIMFNKRLFALLPLVPVLLNTSS